MCYLSHLHSNSQRPNFVSFFVLSVVRSFLHSFMNIYLFYFFLCFFILSFVPIPSLVHSFIRSNSQVIHCILPFACCMFYKLKVWFSASTEASGKI